MHKVEAMDDVTAHVSHALIKGPVQEHAEFIYRFQNTTDGLFWNGNTNRNHSRFNEKGAEFRNERAANQAWRAYEIRRTKDHTLPPLKKLTYRVVLEAVAEEDFNATPEEMTVSLFIVQFGKKAEITSFVRQLSDSAPGQFRYIVQRRGSGKPNEDLRRVLDGMNAPRLSSNSNKKRYIAVRTVTDLIFLKMGAFEVIDTIWDIRTGEPISKESLDG